MHEYNKVKDFVLDCHKKHKKVVFTHGVFDLFHKGHLETLNESKTFGNILIVGVDSDRLVKNLKGLSRPIINDIDKLEVVENIKVVDISFILKPSGKEIGNLHEYFKSLYKYLQVDIVTSGNPSEYCIDQQSICDELGIEYRLAGEKVVETTTDIIERIKAN